MSNDYEVREFLRRLESGAGQSDNTQIVPHGERPCPICGKRMTVESEQGVQTDVCSEHGVWLDLDELQVIISRVRSSEERRRQRAVREAKREGVWMGAGRGIWAFLFLD